MHFVECCQLFLTPVLQNVERKEKTHDKGGVPQSQSPEPTSQTCCRKSVRYCGGPSYAGNPSNLSPSFNPYGSYGSSAILIDQRLLPTTICNRRLNSYGTTLPDRHANGTSLNTPKGIVESSGFWPFKPPETENPGATEDNHTRLQGPYPGKATLCYCGSNALCHRYWKEAISSRRL